VVAEDTVIVAVDAIWPTPVNPKPDIAILAVIVCVPFFRTAVLKPVAMSVKLALTAELKMVVPGMNTFTIANVPLPL
jgi:hypothetical protein